MMNSGASLHSVILKAFTISSTLSVLVISSEAADILGQAVCPSFSCGHLQDMHYPFRLRGDPPGCGVQEYELVCVDNHAIIHINRGRYLVTNISYSESIFSVIDVNLYNSSCPIPNRDHPYVFGMKSANMTLFYPYAPTWATFVSCPRIIKDNVFYRPVACRSTNSSFVYVLTSMFSYSVGKPSCRYLAMTPLGGVRINAPDSLISYDYEHVVKFMRTGFAVQFPFKFQDSPWAYSWIINTCLNDSMSYFYKQISSTSIGNQSSAIVGIDIHFLKCINDYSYQTKLFWAAVVIISAINIMKFIIVLAILSRLAFAPLLVLTFLAYKYWKMKISVDAVEKFLQMQQAFGPTRYAYTDITAITSHFREKLGQGGYGSVYKGVLPGDVHVAIKMLVNSMCNGEEFISEVSTIGNIHHVNVVRLLGFCSEEMGRALVYEYMPHGSLDKYIFSSEKSLSWDKLNAIALGIARGIDYLHRGCDMQILHFDIKPHNILLDSNLIPKVADFGLAKLYPRDNSFVPLSALRGTVGYIAPEMISRSFGVISSKSDVYSFGMLLLEMAGGRRNADPNAPNSSRAYYPSWVYDSLTEREVDEISPAADMHELERKLCIVGLWCIQMRSHDRPTMSEAIEMLEGGVDDLQMPSRPFFCDEGHTHVEDSYHLSSELTAISEEESENIYL
ncbi:rust resistance kinase Lr10-like [Triticum dicoccoides]|uniref:rust resistance kinase Lr10-like n=1 Tax=Triticum dicoccoides TaxID=85692 RepID=UPI000E7A0314|nr:rust resistance kinase Lr10-like [Triticum dicoccoides]